MATKGNCYGAAASASLQRVAKAFESYLSGRIDVQHLLGCMYTAAPGRRGFMRQAQNAFFASASAAGQETKPGAKALSSQLVSFAALVLRALGGLPGATSSEAAQPLQQAEEIVHAGICGAEFWLQHVQQLWSFEAARAAGETEATTETTPLYRELESLVFPLSAAAADRRLPIYTRKLAAEVLLLMAGVALSGAQGAALGGASEPKGGPHQGTAGKRRQALRRVLRKSLEGLIEAPGKEGDEPATAMREEAVAAAHTVLHWPGAPRGSLRAALGPLGTALLQLAQQGALLRNAKAAALARSLLCRLTWLWRDPPRARGDATQQQQQQQQQKQQNPFGGICLFSEALNSAQQSVQSLLASSSLKTAEVEETPQGPERFLLLRSLQLIRDLLLCGGGQAFPAQGAVSSSLTQLEADGGRFLVLNVQSLGQTILAAVTSCCEAFAATVAAAEASVAEQHSKPATPPQQQQQQQQQKSETPQEQQQMQQMMPRRGGKGSRKKWKKQQQQQQQQQQQRTSLAPQVVDSSDRTETESDSSEGASTGDNSSSDSGCNSSRKRGKHQKSSSSNSSSNSSTGNASAQSAIARQLLDLQEAELSATNAATLEAAVAAAQALVEVAGPAGVLPNLSIVADIVGALFNGSSSLENCVLASRFGLCLVSFARGLLHACPAAVSVIHKDCARYAVSVCRQLLGDSSWRRAGRVARAVSLVEAGGLPAMLAEDGHHGATRRRKQAERSKKDSKDIFIATTRSVAAEDSPWGVDTAESEGLLLLTHAWRTTCALIEQLLRAQDQAVVGPSATQLHAFADALVVGLLASGLSWSPGKGDPPRFACLVLTDTSSLIAALRLLTTSINLSLPPLSTLRTASSLKHRLREICVSSFYSHLSAGYPAGSWSLSELEGDSNCSGATSLVLRQAAAAVSGAAAEGAVQAALAELDIAIRNAACTKSTEGAAAAGEAAIEGGDGVACRFVLRAEELNTAQDTSTGMRKPRAGVYAASVASILGFTAAKQLHGPPRTDSQPVRSMAAALPVLHKGRDSPASDCRLLRVPAATPSTASARALLSTIGVEPRAPAGDLKDKTAPCEQPVTIPAVRTVQPSNAQADGQGHQNKRQRVASSEGSHNSPSPLSGCDGRSDDEVVILEGAAPPPPATARLGRNSAGAAANHCAAETFGLRPSLQQQQQACYQELPGAAKGKPIDSEAENEARSRLRQLLHSDSDLSD